MGYICLASYIYIFLKLALANGVLTALYKGPCSVAGHVANAAGNICLSMCLESSHVQKPFVKVTIERNFCQKGYKNQWWSASITKVFEDSTLAAAYKNNHSNIAGVYSNNGYHWVKDYGKAYRAEGILNQFIFVRPEKNLIIVRMGDYPEKRIRASNVESYWMDGFLGFVSEMY